MPNGGDGTANCVTIAGDRLTTAVSRRRGISRSPLGARATFVERGDESFTASSTTLSGLSVAREPTNLDELEPDLLELVEDAVQPFLVQHGAAQHGLDRLDLGRHA